jgi:GNAT superfamily N-acetyltransferase
VKYLVVPEAYRRRGIGTALLEAAVERARKEKRTRVNCFVARSHTPGMSFASARGASPGLVQFQNRLHTAQLDRQLLAGWVTRATERAGDYSLVCFDQICPTEWLTSLAEVISVMNTAPRPEGLGDLVVTGEQVLAQERAHIRRGGWGWTVCALHEPSRRLVGFTELGGSAHRPWLAIQGDTGVDPAHRNLGLGRWIKATNALRVLDERPEVDTVETWNADVNAPMLSINDAMGFRAVATWQEWGVPVT